MTIKEAELVSDRREGRQRLYKLRPRPLREVVAWAEELEHYFAQRLDALERHLDREHGKK